MAYLLQLRDRERGGVVCICIFNTKCNMVGNIIALQGYFRLMEQPPNGTTWWDEIGQTQQVQPVIVFD